MTEADLYPHLAHLAGGQVYPYVVPLLDGRPSVALPWVVFSLISSVSADVMGGQAESSVSVQIDVYAGTVTQARQIRQDAREAIMLLAPGSVSEMQDYIPENRCYRATTGVSGHGVIFSTEPITRRVRVFYYQEAECLLCMNVHS